MHRIFGILGWGALFYIQDYFILKSYSGHSKYFMSNLHAITSVLFSLILLCGPKEYHKNTENVLISSMIGYFIADLYNVFTLDRYDMCFHHIFSILSLLYLPTNNSFESNLISKVVLLEISTPYLNMYKITKKPIYGVFLLFTFFIFRIIWLSYIYYKVYNISETRLDVYIKIILFVFVLLNYYWFSKMLSIAYRKLPSLRS